MAISTDLHQAILRARSARAISASLRLVVESRDKQENARRERRRAERLREESARKRNAGGVSAAGL